MMGADDGMCSPTSGAPQVSHLSRMDTITSSAGHSINTVGTIQHRLRQGTQQIPSLCCPHLLWRAAKSSRRDLVLNEGEEEKPSSARVSLLHNKLTGKDVILCQIQWNMPKNQFQSNISSQKCVLERLLGTLNNSNNTVFPTSKISKDSIPL